MPLAQLEDCEIYYEEYGQGTPLIFIAGLGGVGSYWEPQIRTFASKYRVIVFDHRGAGQSTRSRIRYSLEQMAADTIGLMNALDIESAHLVGHSTGGAIAQILCLEHRHRVMSAVLYATWTRADTFFRRCFEVRRELLKAGPEAYVRGSAIFLEPSWVIRDSEAQQEGVLYGSGFDTEIVDSRIEALLHFDRKDKLAKIDLPVLVVGVRNDHLTPLYYSEELARIIPSAELTIMEDGAHVASQVKPREFNELIERFILRHERADESV